MDFLPIFSELVFPIAIVAYLLFSTSKKLEEIRDEMNELNKKIAILLDRQDRGSGK